MKCLVCRKSRDLDCVLTYVAVVTLLVFSLLFIFALLVSW